jgi:hypothetical protein
MKRSTWFSIAVGTLFNIAFCFVVARVFSPSEPGSAFLILLVTVWGVGLLIHLKARIVKALIYYLGGKQQRIEATVDELVRLRMPAGASYQNAASEYFSQVANDEDESKDARLYAGTMIGILTLMPLYSRTDARQLRSVVETALRRYSQTINRRRDEIGSVEGARTVTGASDGESAAAFELPVRGTGKPPSAAPPVEGFAGIQVNSDADRNLGS